MTIDIEVEDERWQLMPRLVSHIGRAVQSVGEEKRDLTILLTSDAEMQILNRDWRGQDKPTNVLSFPAPEMPLPKGELAPLGDIALAYETIMKEAGEQGKSPEDHTLHLVVHGVLHLLGYDHDTDAEAERMEAREREILANLGIADPYR
jgi:probable rRNA maturation factor